MEIKIGDGGGIHGYSDSYACTVVGFKGKKGIIVQRDKATLLNQHELQVSVGGFCAHVEGTQKYAFEADTEAQKEIFTLRKNGDYIKSGQKTGPILTLGQRIHHYDYNF